MKKSVITRIIVLTLLVTGALAAEKKPMKDVDTDAFTSDTLLTLKEAGDRHMAMVWWLPIEFWETILARDTTTSEIDKKNMLDTLSGISLVAAVQADISSFGAFNFYSKDEVEETLQVSYTDATGAKQILSVMKTVDPDVEMLLNIFKPILGSAMGNMGNNMHFYVFSDQSKSKGRVLDPYQTGIINIGLKKKNGAQMSGVIETPLNALFIPRKCPNGKEAHISWKYCPWTGSALDK